jgi:ribosomal protein L11 methyltransferase
MRWADITLRVPPASVEPVSAVLNVIGCAGVVVHDPNAVSSDPFADWSLSDGIPTPKAAPARVTGYLPVDDRLESLLDDLQARLQILRESGIDAGDGVTLRTVDDESWADAWKAYYKPIRVGTRFVVKPSWEVWEAAPDDLVIELDPGMAFGTGSHPTTRLCLEVLEETVRSGDRILDWGAGSGILAVGAALLGAAEVLAIDLDPIAVHATTENAARSGLAGTIRTEVASIEALAVDPAYDVIIANIVADPIICGAPEIRRRLRPGGHAILSGVIDRRAVEVLEAVQGVGLTVTDVYEEGEWRAFRVRG